MRGQQLPLPVQLRESASFETYCAGPNAEALAAVRDGQTALLLYGAASSGKTHLLQAYARASGARYLPLREWASFGAAVLEGYAEAPLLCLDDLDAVSPLSDWCLALLRLLDTRRVQSLRWVATAQAPPDRLSVALPDLKTRLSTAAVYGLKPLSDAERATLLQERARARGLEMSEEISRWMLTRLPRDTGSLITALEKLDQAALIEQRRLTLPFVQQVTLALLQPPLPLVHEPASGRTESGH